MLQLTSLIRRLFPNPVKDRKTGQWNVLQPPYYCIGGATVLYLIRQGRGEPSLVLGDSCFPSQCAIARQLQKLNCYLSMDYEKARWFAGQIILHNQMMQVNDGWAVLNCALAFTTVLPARTQIVRIEDVTIKTG